MAASYPNRWISPTLLVGPDHNSLWDWISGSANDYSYVAYSGSGLYWAKNGTTGLINFSGSNARVVIQSVFNQLQPSGGILLLREGTYTIDLKLHISGSGIKVTGPRKAVLKLANSVNDNVIVVENNAVGVILEGFSIDGNKANQATASTGVVIAGFASRCTIKNMQIDSCKAYGAYIFESDYCSAIDNTITNTDEHGLAVEGFDKNVYGTRIIGNDIRNTGIVGPTRTGITCEGSRTNGFFPLDTIIQGNFISGSYNGIGLLNAPRSIILGNNITDCSQGAISISNCENNIIEGNVCNNTDISGSFPYRDGIRIDDSGVTPGSFDTIIRGNQCLNHENGGSGIKILGTPNRILIEGNICNFNQDGIVVASSTGSQINNNLCYQNKQGGIIVITSKNVAVNGNVCLDNDTSGSSPYRSGIRIDDNGISTGSSYITINSNICSEHADVGILIMGSGSSCVITSNQCHRNSNGIQLSTGDNKNIIMADNDVTENTSLSISLTGSGHFVARNKGFNPQGTVLIAAGASPFTYTNNDFVQEAIYISGSTGAISDISKNSISLFPSGSTNATVFLEAGEDFTITYPTGSITLIKDRK